MKRSRWHELVTLFDRYAIKPIIGVVPDNQDMKLQVDPPNSAFWSLMQERERAGWLVAQHGYQHRYQTTASGLLRLRSRSEFAGLPYDAQYQAISAGKKILEERLSRPVTWWTAPSHSFDATTCQVLRELTFTHISDGIALYPFQEYGLTWVPHQLWQPAWRPFGVWTIGLHLNTMSDQSLSRLRLFIHRHANQFQHVPLHPQSHPLTNLYRQAWYAKWRCLKYINKLQATS